MCCPAEHSSRTLFYVVLFVLAAAFVLAPEWTFAQEAPGAVPAPHAEAPPPDESTLWWIIKTSGFIGLFIFILMTYFIATVMKLFVDMKAEKTMPPQVV